MATLEQLQNALVNADKAGDADAARVFAGEIRKLRAIPKQEKYDPTEGMSGFDKFAAGAGKAMYDIGRGAGQLFGVVSPDDIEETRRLDKPLMDTGAGFAGNVVGNVATALPTAFIPGVNTITGGALTGAALSALQPVGKDESRLQNMAIGGVLGGAVPAVIKGAKTLKTALYDPLANQNKVIGNVLTRATGPDAEKVAQILRQGSQGATPGVRLPAGAISQNEGLAAIEDAIASQVPSGQLNRAAQSNRNALADALRGIGGTPEEIASAEAAREGAAQSLYGRAFQSDAMRRQLAKDAADSTKWLAQTTGPIITEDLATPGLRSLADRPAFQAAINEAKNLAANKGIRLDDPLQSLEGLHYIKLALDDMSKPGAMTSLGRNQAASIESVKGALTKELEKISPLYGNARQTFADMSQPINQMQIGNSLVNKLLPASATDNPAALNYASLLRSLRDPDSIAKSATGFKGATMQGVLSPEQFGTVQSVGSDAAKIAEALRRGSGMGSATARRLATGDMLSNYFANEAPITSRVISIAGKIPGVNLATKGVSAIGSLATDKINANMLGRLDEMLANNPQEVAALISKELERIEPSARQQIISRLPQSIALSIPQSYRAQ